MSDLASIETLLRGFLSPRNDERRSAEASLLSLRAGAQLASMLLTVARSSSVTELRQLSCVLLRRVVHFGENKLWPNLDAQTRASLCCELLASLLAEPVRAVRHALCDMIASVAADMMEDDERWPDLWVQRSACPNAST